MLGAIAANLAIYAGWSQSTTLRVLAAGAFLLVTVAGVVVHVGLRPGVQSSFPSKEDIPFFRGRARELNELLERHRQLLSNPFASRRASGPLMLAIHGRPGVGKTALAQQLALRLRDSYPDGLLYENLGTGGGPRPPRDILHSLLRELNWPEEEMRGMDAAELGGVFRARTADKRMLVLLDAARSLEQIRAVLPGGSGCTVITTSRANLLAGQGQHSQRLGPVSAGEAAEILLGALGRDLTTKPDLVAEAVELCDFQPDALLSVGDRARNEGLHQTIRRLRPAATRLDILRYGGRDVGERIASEYHNLEVLERKAFLLLTIPESATFVPWALQPLLNAGSVEAGNLVASISRVGLLELVGRDPSGLGRYRFSSLARLFAEQQLLAGDIVSPVEAALAQDRFRLAYLAGSVKVLRHLGVPDLPAPAELPDHWYPQVPGWEGKVAARLDAWVRAEFGSLIRAVEDAAGNGLPALCWQIAARLGDCFSPPAEHEGVQRAFETAVRAAQGDLGSQVAEIRVRMARSGYLTAVHDYYDAIEELNTVASLAASLRDEAAQAEALRRLAYAWHELADYERAEQVLKQCQSIVAAGSREERLIRLLRAENGAFRDPALWTAEVSGDGVSPDLRDNSQFVERIILGRAARRRRIGQACDDLLGEAQRYADQDLAHGLDIEQERAATMLHCDVAVPVLGDSRDGHAARQVISLAAQLVRSSDRLDRPSARAQARCTLAQALARAGQIGDSLVQLKLAEQIVESLPEEEGQRLRMRVRRVRGEVLLRDHRAQDAVVALETAERWLATREPWAHAETLVLLGTGYRELGRLGAALAAHSAAAQAFRRHRDEVAGQVATTELTLTLRAAGAGRRRARRMGQRLG